MKVQNCYRIFSFLLLLLSNINDYNESLFLQGKRKERVTGFLNRRSKFKDS